VSFRVHNEALTRHFLGLFQPHDVENGRGHVGQDTVLQLRVPVPCHIDDGNRIDGVCRVGRAVVIEGMVCVAVVGEG
jgi:hypothetical protein